MSMRLSDWRAAAPRKDSMAPKVVATIEAALSMLGADADPECWVVWGDDPAIRYTVFVPGPAGLAQINVRVMVPGEGPRAAGKLIRWNRIQLGELAIEIQGGHRLINFQVEGNVLRGSDADADVVAEFVMGLYDAIDGRSAPVAVVATAGPAPAKAKRRGKPVPLLPPPKADR
jgi:hypothetical protein